ncbi:MAG TPA: membrane protein insertase YidC [Bacteroidia bacterium]|jgi:YidC/Oxa1 family membrane protein insertase|nr:membrane protein insertase YidC [Bacteroidia bacterium]
MDRNSLIGLVLIGGILIGWLVLNGPSNEEIRKAKQKQDSLIKVALAEKAKAEAAAIATFAKNNTDTSVVKGDATVAKIINTDSLKKAGLQNKYRDFSAAVEGKGEQYIFTNEKIQVTFQSKGGSIASVVLNEYTRPDKKTKVELFSGDSVTQALVFLAYNNTLQVRTDSLYFKLQDSKKTADAQIITFRLPTTNPANYIEYVYTIKNNDYMVGCKVNLVNMQGIISQNTDQLDFLWKMMTPSQEEHIEKEKQASTVYWKFKEEDSDYINPGKEEEKSIAEAPVEWIAFKQQFFTSAVIYDKGFTSSKVKTALAKNSLTSVKNFEAIGSVPYTHGEKESVEMRFYFGPNQYNILKSYGVELETMINIGWPVFNLINKWLVIPVFNAFNNSTVNFGIIILILTIIIKTLLFPIAYKTYFSSSKMRVLKPELDIINKKYPDAGDAMKKNQESMALYKRAGASPFSGCIPALIQFPILIALLNFFPASIELRQKAFLWAQDLSTYDSVWTFGHVPVINSIYGDHVSLFALLMFGSTIIYTWMNSKFYTPANQQQMPGMKFMMYFMPFIFLSFMNSYSSGLSWYYFLANVITFAQTWAMRKFVSDEKLRAQIDEHMKKPVKKSKFAQRLEEISKQRQGAISVKPKKK